MCTFKAIVKKLQKGEKFWGRLSLLASDYWPSFWITEAHRAPTISLPGCFLVPSSSLLPEAHLWPYRIEAHTLLPILSYEEGCPCALVVKVFLPEGPSLCLPSRHATEIGCLSPTDDWTCFKLIWAASHQWAWGIFFQSLWNMSELELLGSAWMMEPLWFFLTI